MGSFEKYEEDSTIRKVGIICIKPSYDSFNFHGLFGMNIAFSFDVNTTPTLTHIYNGNRNDLQNVSQQSFKGFNGNYKLIFTKASQNR